MNFKEKYIVKTKEITALIRFLANDLLLYLLKTSKNWRFFMSPGGIEVANWPESGWILLMIRKYITWQKFCSSKNIKIDTLGVVTKLFS